MKPKLLIICGGNSSEHEVSLLSCKNVVDAVDQNKYDMSVAVIDKNDKVMLLDDECMDKLLNDVDASSLMKITKSNLPASSNQHDISYLAKTIRSSGETIVFPLIHGNFGEDGKLQGILETLNVPFVGSSASTSAICMDKDITKLVVGSLGIKVADYLVIKKTDRYPSFTNVVQTIGLPFFVKPARQGSSVGVTKVEKEDDYLGALLEGFRYDRKILLERAIKGMELECAVLGNETPEASRVGKIVLHKDEFYSYKNKYTDEKGAVLELPAYIDSHLEEEIRSQALNIYKRLDCKGFARVDFFVEKGEIIFNEVNTIPGFTNISMYPKLWEISGLNYSELIDRLVAHALEAHRES